ncbi:MAG: kynureninase, partial [Gammaproteobacteria bacterium]
RYFEIPRIDERPATYLCGHSLGLMPRKARSFVERELDRWATHGVDGHFGDGGWFDYHRRFAAPLAWLTGARRSEVVAMNSLTVNLHLLLLSFYRPSGRRGKIVIEQQAFPSDRYAVASQLLLHGRDPETDLLELRAAETDQGIRPADLQSLLERHRGEVALVLLPGVQYLSGQVLDIASLTRVAHANDCLIGFDLAHSIGNASLQLHKWQTDFAVWCSYKYLNGGPGAIGGCFVHSRHDHSAPAPRLAGWWGHNAQRRFLMEHEFDPSPGAEGFQLSNPPILAMAPLRASLRHFEAAGLQRLRKKSRALNRFMRSRVEALLGDSVSVRTPRTAGAAQISLQLKAGRPGALECAAALHDRRIVIDAREPDILRLAAVPLYNRFTDVERAVQALARLV